MNNKSKQELLIENLRSKIDAGEIHTLNAPRTEEYVRNSRRESLHVRTDWSPAFKSLGLKPPSGDSRSSKNALIVMMHGMGGHNNRPSVVHNAYHYIAKGYKVCAFDFHGHGYSNNFTPVGQDYDEETTKLNRAQGETDPLEEYERNRNCIKRWEYLLDDITCVLRALYGDGDREEFDFQKKVPEHKLFLHASQDMPFFLMGVSMGGAISLIMGSILHKIAKCNGRGLCGGGLPSSYCDEDFLEKFGPGADNSIRKTCFAPVMSISSQLSSVLLAPFFANSATIFSKVVSVFSTPTHRNSLLVGEESDATVPGSASNAQVAAGAVVGIVQIEDGGGEREESDDGQTDVEMRASSASPEEQIGLPFLDSSLLPLARMCVGVVLTSPAIYVNPPHPVLRTALDTVVARLAPSSTVPEVFRKTVGPSANWLTPEFVEYSSQDGFPKGLSYDANKSIRFRTAATMLTLLDAVALEIPDMEMPYLCVMDPEDKMVSIKGVEVLMERCGENHRMYREDVLEAAYDVAVSASAPQPTVEEEAGRSTKGKEKIHGIPTNNDYGRFVAIPGGAHGCLENKMDELFDATNVFLEERLARERGGLEAVGRVDL